MNKFAQQFNSDVIVRYQQKMAALTNKVAFKEEMPPLITNDNGDSAFMDDNGTLHIDMNGNPSDDVIGPRYNSLKDYGHLKADDMQVPETTWFERLSNSSPISALLDAAEATGVDRWADSVNNFIGDPIGNISDWATDIGKGAQGDIAQALTHTLDNISFNDMQNEAINTFNRYKEENPFADVSFVPQADQGVLSVLMDKSPDTIARNIGKIPSEAVRKFDPRYMNTSLDAFLPIAGSRSRTPDYFGGLKADETGYSFYKPQKGELQIGVYPKDMPRVGPVNLDNLSIK